MNEHSPNSEDLIEEMEDQEDNGDELFENEGHDHESEGHHGFGIESDDHENDGEQFLIDANIHEESEQGLELEGEDHCSDSQQFLEVRVHNAENETFHMLDLHANDEVHNLGNNTMGVDDEDGLSKERYYHPPTVGMEFESYDDAYNYYNCYAKELGFAIRVKSSWTKRNSKEKRGAVLCCNCEGFKTFKEASCRRKETRTGCLAMMRLRLVETNRWRIDEAKLEHNHLFDPERVQNSKSHKKMEVSLKRDLEPTVDVEVRTIKLYRTSVVDAASSWNLTSRGGDKDNHIQPRFLKLKSGDSQAMHNYFCQKQLTSPNFFYIMDLNDEGQLRNVFWIDSPARAGYSYFGDVVVVDTTCLSNKYEIPLVAFTGINHHGQSILLGCAFIAEDTVETYVWLFRTWLTCMLGHPPQTIVTDRFKAIQIAISEVFPRAHHRFWLPLVMQSIILNLGQLQEFEAFQSILSRTVYNSLKIDEFETSWDNMIDRFGIRDHEWLRVWYEDREKWAPAYQKDTFLAGLFAVQTGESFNPFFAAHIHEKTSVQEFFDLYDVMTQKIRLKETLDDLESSESNLLLRTRCYYELQLSKFYTKRIFEKFQVEVEMMSCCVTINQVHTSGPVTTYVVKEHEGSFEAFVEHPQPQWCGGDTVLLYSSKMEEGLQALLCTRC
ncbi:protein FAR1-RELATED SEQUENCE 8 isoform X2 [Spinacia oleracea]|uniref:Protein FAR1-RELATED SEQUENCE n=1 Tax=Spinacia oleracea TaxID=3562 RepID=A0A9R0IA87_SPIOL|nr:protein FAR1-RELATED SEQUENCE 8-like isoform X2 [Spinacia oleracea]